MKTKIFSLTRKDFTIEYFSGSGAGGQHRNKHRNCVRIFHSASNVRTTGQEHRSRRANIRDAFARLTADPRFKIWLMRKADEIKTGKTIDEVVDEMMDAGNLKTEYRDEKGQWHELRRLQT